MASDAPPVEPGCYIVLSLVGAVEEWGPRLAGRQRSPAELVELLFAWRDAGSKISVLRSVAQGHVVQGADARAYWRGMEAGHLRDLIVVDGGGLVTRIEPTEKGRAVLALADALERGRR